MFSHSVHALRSMRINGRLSKMKVSFGYCLRILHFPWRRFHSVSFGFIRFHSVLGVCH